MKIIKDVENRPIEPRWRKNRSEEWTEGFWSGVVVLLLLESFAIVFYLAATGG